MEEATKQRHRSPGWWQSCFQRRGNQSQPCHGAEQGADPLLPPHCQDEPICKPKQKPELQLWADLQQGSFAVGFPLRCFLNHISLPGGLWAPRDHLELLHGISVQFYSTGLGFTGHSATTLGQEFFLLCHLQLWMLDFKELVKPWVPANKHHEITC